MPRPIGGLGEIAPRTTGHQNFHAGLAILFKQQRFQTACSGSLGGNQPSGTGADDDDIPMRG